MHEKWFIYIGWTMNRKYKTILLIIIYYTVISLWLRFCFGKLFFNGQDNESGSLGKTEFLVEEKEDDRDMSLDVADAEQRDGNEQKREEIEEQEQQEKQEQQEEQKEQEEQDKLDIHTIRILIKTDDGQIYHDKILFQFQGETLEITAKSKYFKKSDHIKIALFPSTIAQENVIKQIQVCSITRNKEHPFYSGSFEIYCEEEGLVLVNETSLEEYVKGVLPGEMPSSYPTEALKAQAICARTYACMKKVHPFYPEWNVEVDDSTSCQVYGYHTRTELTDLAVDETRGKILLNRENELEQCYYYSTSCGISAPVNVWHGSGEDDLSVTKSAEQIREMNQEFKQYITQIHDSHLEKEEPFYRWNYTVEKVDKDIFLEKIKERYRLCSQFIRMDGEQSIDSLGKIKNMRIVERLNSSIADCLEVEFEKGMIDIWGEYNIRYVLAQKGFATLQDGAKYEIQSILPSAFIALELICNKKGNVIGYSLIGGGFGHGVGMSQNGAKHMAKAGNSAEEILKTYYSGCSLVNLDDYKND